MAGFRRAGRTEAGRGFATGLGAGAAYRRADLTAGRAGFGGASGVLRTTGRDGAAARRRARLRGRVVDDPFTTGKRGPPTADDAPFARSRRSSVGRLGSGPSESSTP